MDIDTLNQEIDKILEEERLPAGIFRADEEDVKAYEGLEGEELREALAGDILMGASIMEEPMIRAEEAEKNGTNGSSTDPNPTS